MSGVIVGSKIEARVYGLQTQNTLGLDHRIPGLDAALSRIKNDDQTTVVTDYQFGRLTCHWDPERDEWYVTWHETDGPLTSKQPKWVTWTPTAVRFIRMAIPGNPVGAAQRDQAGDVSVTRTVFMTGGGPAFNLVVTGTVWSDIMFFDHFSNPDYGRY